MTIQQKIDSLTPAQLRALFEECEWLERTGMLPEDTELRKIAIEHYGEDTVMFIHYVAFYVYRRLAMDFIGAST